MTASVTPAQTQTRAVRTVVSKGFRGEDLPQGYSVRMLNFLPHVHQHHALGVDEAETCRHVAATQQVKSPVETRSAQSRNGAACYPARYTVEKIKVPHGENLSCADDNGKTPDADVIPCAAVSSSQQAWSS